jgi:hypothetical protein
MYDCGIQSAVTEARGSLRRGDRIKFCDRSRGDTPISPSKNLVDPGGRGTLEGFTNASLVVVPVSIRLA